MPGGSGSYEHVSVRFLNECDTATRPVAAAPRTAAPGLDGTPLPIHDPIRLERLFKKLRAAANVNGK